MSTTTTATTTTTTAATTFTFNLTFSDVTLGPNNNDMSYVTSTSATFTRTMATKNATTEPQYTHHVASYGEGVMATLCVVLGSMILATVLGNVFVITAILVERSLQGVSNYLVLSLAVTDLLVAVLVMPLSLLNEVSMYWYLGRAVCDMWVSMDVLCCTASILHLVAIAMDRFWAVSNIDYVRQRCASKILLMIGMVWLVSVAISIPPLFGWRHESDNPELSGVCMISQDHGYTIFSTVGAFYCPLVLMLVLNFKIYRAASYRIRRKAFAAARGGSGVGNRDKGRGRRSTRRDHTAVPVVMVEPDSKDPNRPSSGSDVSQDGVSLYNPSFALGETSRADSQLYSYGAIGDSLTDSNENESYYPLATEDPDVPLSPNCFLLGPLPPRCRQGSGDRACEDHSPAPCQPRDLGLCPPMSSKRDVCQLTIPSPNIRLGDGLGVRDCEEASLMRDGDGHRKNVGLHVDRSQQNNVEEHVDVQLNNVSGYTDGSRQINGEKYVGDAQQRTVDLRVEASQPCDLGEHRDPGLRGSVVECGVGSVGGAGTQCHCSGVQGSEHVGTAEEHKNRSSHTGGDVGGEGEVLDIRPALASEGEGIGQADSDTDRRNSTDSARVELACVHNGNPHNHSCSHHQANGLTVVRDGARDNCDQRVPCSNCTHDPVAHANVALNPYGTHLAVPRLRTVQPSKKRANNNTKRARNREKEKQRREKLEMRRERKAARVLGIITGAFVLCWLPFFILALLGPFLPLAMPVPPVLISLFLWLGYFNSLLNPIIYTVFNPSFRKAFRKIFFRRLRSVARS